MEQGKLDLDAKAFSILNITQSAVKDRRIYDITIRNLLQHSGGWDREKSFDPMFISNRAASEIGAPQPASSETIIRFMLGQQLDFDPGSRFAYSNFGYCILSRIIEKVTGQSYQNYVNNQILIPLGITQARIGRSLIDERVKNEVRYYDFPSALASQSVFPNISGLAPTPYGGFYLEAMDSHGGWITSAIDLVRFAVALEGSKSPNLLKPETAKTMVSRPQPPLWVGTPYYYGTGWLVRPVSNDANWWHTGSLPGTATILVRTNNGFVWAALFNSRPTNGGNFLLEVDNALWKAAREVTEWPTHNLFKQYGYK